MAKTLPPNMHFQLRLVKRFDGTRVVTHPNLGQPNEGTAKDHVLDLFDNERSVLQAARNYCARGEKRKGSLPGQFLGVVVVKFEGDPSRWKSVKPGSFSSYFKLSRRPPRVKGKTIWLYYVDPQSKAFHMDARTRQVMAPVV